MVIFKVEATYPHFLDTIILMSNSSPLLPKFVSPESDSLNQQSLKVPVAEIPSEEIQGIIDTMLKIAFGEQGDEETKTMVGLAAPQIGINKRVIIVGVDSQGDGETPILNEYINPKIIKSSEETVDGREGCYSTSRVCGIVSRSRSVTIEAYKRDGSKVTEEHEDFPARIFQHEIDHLDGIRFPDKIMDDSKLHWVESDRFGEYRERWAEWDTLCKRSKWESIKSGR